MDPLTQKDSREEMLMRNKVYARIVYAKVYAKIVAFGLFCSTAAYAGTISYDLNLTAPKAGGSGILTLDVAPSDAPGVVSTYYAATNGVADGGILDAFNVTVAGLTFNLSNASEATSVQFTGGVLSGVTYGTSIGSTAFQTNGLIYGVHSISDPSLDQIGTVTAAPVVPSAASPEPGTFLLLGTGLLGVAGVMKRRFV
jgi:hypothetical protein